MLKFNEDDHIYTWDGKRVPSVTQVLREWLLIDDMYINRFTGARVAKSAFDRGADRGRAIHDGLNILIQGKELDWDALDPSLLHPLRAAQLWIDHYKPVLVEIGKPLYSKKYGYAGTFDILTTIKIGGRRRLSLTDAKSGMAKLVGPQTAAYEQLYRENERYRGPILRHSLFLPPSEAQGSLYRFMPAGDRDDFRFFEACLTEHFYLEGKR